MESDVQIDDPKKARQGDIVTLTATVEEANYDDGMQLRQEGKYADQTFWVPNDAVERIVRHQPGEVSCSDFSDALLLLKAGARVARAGWNGKGMWLLLIKNWTVHQGYADRVDGLLPLPWIGMRTADDSFVPWLASQTDLLADDWLIVEEL